MKQWFERKRWLLLLVAGVVSILVIAACGGDDNKDEEQPTVPQTPQAEAPCEGGPGVVSNAVGGVQAQAAEPLKIGLLQPSTGGLASYGPIIANGAKLAAKCINNYGGVNGAEVQLIEADSGSLPEPATAAAQQLVDVDGVVAIVGPAGSTPSQAVAESVTIPAGVLMITPSGTSPALTALDDNDFVFRTTISDAAQGLVLAQLVSDDLGLDSVCVMYVNNAYGEGLKDTFEGAYTGTVTAAVAHAEEGVTFLSELQECTADSPQALVAISYTTGQADIYLQEALENNIIDNFVFVDGTKDADLFAELGWENFADMYGTAPGALPPESGQAFDAMYAAEYGEPYSIPFVREAYDSVVALALAAQKAGTNTDATAIRDALRDVSNAPGTQYGGSEDQLAAIMQAVADGEDVDYTGASGAVEFDDNGDVSFGAVDVWQVQGEEIVTVRTVSVDLTTGTIQDVTEMTGDDTGANDGADDSSGNDGRATSEAADDATEVAQDAAEATQDAQQNPDDSGDGGG